MAAITIVPNMKTLGGEASDIMLGGRYVGAMTLLFRERDRVCGSIHLERGSMTKQQKKAVMAHMQEHVQSFLDAVRASSCQVLVTCGPYDHFIATDEAYEQLEDEEGDDEDSDYEWDEEDSRFDDVGEGEPEWTEMNGLAYKRQKPVYTLVVAREGRSRIDYRLHDEQREWVAEASLGIADADVSGEVNWLFEPDDEEIEAATELLVADFGEETIDTFVIHHRFEDELLETVELTHRDLLDSVYEDEDEEEGESSGPYSVVLARDDGDTLTYDIYNQSRGGLPVASATVDIGLMQPSGFIEFHQPNDEDGMETIAGLLRDELDREQRFDRLSLTLLFRNRPIDEIVFDQEPYH
ncbi:MAG: hypothetical protein J7639_23585 [Paenibacillaceae bacterium]|nr:hypothetical protein [Paenibacillaceae bacterium]